MQTDFCVNIYANLRCITSILSIKTCSNPWKNPIIDSSWQEEFKEIMNIPIFSIISLIKVKTSVSNQELVGNKFFVPDSEKNFNVDVLDQNEDEHFPKLDHENPGIGKCASFDDKNDYIQAVLKISVNKSSKNLD